MLDQEQSVASVSRNLKTSIRTLNYSFNFADFRQIVGTADHDPRILDNKCVCLGHKNKRDESRRYQVQKYG